MENNAVLKTILQLIIVTCVVTKLSTLYTNISIL